MTRATHGRYSDPLDEIWSAVVARLGWTLRRSDDTYASWNGRDTLTLCTPASYDADDSTAQLILHEICHGLVQGPDGVRRVDWGLDNTDDARAATQEHACHRLQAALLDRYGLRDVLAVTTDWRSFWDTLPEDPLADPTDPAAAMARDAWPRALRGRWSGALHEALRATARLAEVTAPFAAEGSLWRRAKPLHPLGVAAGPGSCGACAWRDGNGRCVAEATEGSPGPAVTPAWPGCYRFEAHAELDCRACGACCREGYHLVPCDDDSPLRSVHPELVAVDAHGAHLPRPDGRCVALDQGAAGWTCRVYALRPSGCRDLPPGGEACLVARRRTGLSRR